MLILCDVAGTGIFIAWHILRWILIPVVVIALISGIAWAVNKSRQRQKQAEREQQRTQFPKENGQNDNTAS